jgi:hypothetical protein
MILGNGMTDDKYKNLRDALSAGPKPGKWTWKQVGSFSTPGCAIFWPDSSKGGVHYRRLDSGGGMEQVDADYIAAAHPETIRALLAERDALRAAVLAIDSLRGPFMSDDDIASVWKLVDSALAQHQGEKHDNQD